MKRDRDERREIEVKREERRDERRRAPHYKINCVYYKNNLFNTYKMGLFRPRIEKIITV